MSDESFSVLVDFKNRCKALRFDYDDHIKNIEETWNTVSLDVFNAHMTYCREYTNKIHYSRIISKEDKGDLLNKYMALWLKVAIGMIYGKKAYSVITDNPHYIAQYCAVMRLMKDIQEMLRTYPNMEEVMQIYNGFFSVNSHYLNQ